MFRVIYRDTLDNAYGHRSPSPGPYDGSRSAFLHAYRYGNTAGVLSQYCEYFINRSLAKVRSREAYGSVGCFYIDGRYVAIGT